MKLIDSIPIRTLGRALGAALVACVPTAAQTPLAHDVLGQIADLDPQPTPLAFYRGEMPLPGPFANNRTSHFQGMARHPDPDAAVIYVSYSGGSDGAGNRAHIAAVQIASAERSDSARLRSNRLVADVDLSGSPPFPTDKVVWSLDVDDDENHPAGMQAAGDYLAVSFTDSGYVYFYDITNPVAPVQAHVLAMPGNPLDLDADGNELRYKPSACALIQQPDGRYVLGVWCERLHPGRILWFQSTNSNISTMTLVADHDPPLQWPKTLEGYCPGTIVGGNCTTFLQTPPGLNPLLQSNWAQPDNPYLQYFDLYQELVGLVVGGESALFGTFNSLALVQDADGMYLTGMWNTTNLAPVLRGNDVLATYRVQLLTDASGTITGAGTQPLLLEDTRTFRSWADGTGFALTALLTEDAYCGNFHAGATVYVSPEGELLLYTIEHYGVGVLNWNVATWPSDNADYVAFGEYHAPRSPYLDPPTDVTGSITLYSEENYKGHRVELDLVDYYYENWTYFSSLPGPCAGFLCDFSNAVQSMSWRLPAAHTITLYQDENFSGGNIQLSGIGAFPNLHAYPHLIQDVASLKVEVAGEPLYNRWGMHLLSGLGAAPRQVVPLGTETLKELLPAFEPRLIELESGTFDKPTSKVIDFPTRLRTLGGTARIK